MSVSRVLQKYREEKRLTIAQLARELGVPQRTLEYWLAGKRVPILKYRQILNQKFPGIFADEQQLPVGLPEEQKPSTDSAEALINISLARILIAGLGQVLSWFLFKVSAKERNRFRETLGEEWNRFFDLCRAMLGEKAFEVVKRETGIADKTKEDGNE